jgi:sulfite exporter TauE/SafE/copper chaperone CopZ
MHCNSCKLLLERSISTIDKVRNVDANVQKWTVTIWYEQIPNLDEIKETIHECGYEISEEEVTHPWLSTDINDYKILLFSLVLFILLYLILNTTGVSSLFDIQSQWTPSFPLVVLIGITAGFSSCMAVVGWLVLAISSKWNTQKAEQTFWQKIIPHLRFNIRRVVWFWVLWWILGLVWSMISLSPFMMSVMTLIVWVIMTILWINLTQISPRLSAISISLPTGNLFSNKETKLITQTKTWSRTHLWTFGSGVLTFFLPCGFTFAMQLYAISTWSFRMWMTIMTLFALWTLPWLLGIGSLTSIFRRKKAQIGYKAIWVLVILLWLYNIANSYNVVSTRLHLWATQEISQNTQISEIINMQYTDSWLTPSTIYLEIDKVYAIIIDTQTTVYGCMSTIYIPWLDENIQSVKQGEKIKFLVDAAKSWTYEFRCAMWLSHNARIIVK